jgi:hypothetical protein
LRAHARRYGPFWIAATLVFIAAATGNLASYLSYVNLLRTTPDATWTYDIAKVTLSAVLFYGYITILPLLVRLAAARSLCAAPQPSARDATAWRDRYTWRCVTGRRRPA